jgi:hypothetical protein
MFSLSPDLFVLSAAWSQMAPIWVKCLVCDDFICVVHEKHVCECDCPSIEFWVFSPHSH